MRQKHGSHADTRPGVQWGHSPGGFIWRILPSSSHAEVDKLICAFDLARVRPLNKETGLLSKVF